MKAKYPIVTEKARTQKELVNTYALLDEITEQMTADDIYVSGSSGTCIDVSMQTFRVKRDSVYFVPKVLRQWDLVCLQQLEPVWQVTEEERYVSMEMVVSDEYSGTGNNTPIESSNQDFCVEQSGICADSRNTENIFRDIMWPVMRIPI